jgi:hypothetical protein
MKQRKFFSTILIGTCLLTLASCGNDNDDSSNGSTGSGAREEQQLDDQGVYRAVLSPLNTNVAGNTSGTVEIRVEGDEVIAESNVTGAPAGVKHLQNITFSSACPAENADVNNDSFVDAAEAAVSTGPILIPLDSDLSDQLNGMSYGPIANSAGMYFYRRSSTLSNILGDLRSVDPDITDPVIKLSPEQDLNLANRVVVVHGVASSANLPGTVTSYGDLPASQTLPIACGKLVRISNEDTTGGTVTISTVESEDASF